MNSRDDCEWISRAEACRRLSIAKRTLARLVADGLVAELRIPNAKPKVRAADVRRILDRSTSRSKVDD